MCLMSLYNILCHCLDTRFEHVLNLHHIEHIKTCDMQTHKQLQLVRTCTHM